MTEESRETILQISSDSRMIDTTSFSTILTTYWDQPAPSFFNGSEDTPEYDRRKIVSVGICRSVGNSEFTCSFATM
jgi:hypothetical protein